MSYLTYMQEKTREGQERKQRELLQEWQTRIFEQVSAAAARGQDRTNIYIKEPIYLRTNTNEELTQKRPLIKLPHRQNGKASYSIKLPYMWDGCRTSF